MSATGQVDVIATQTYEGRVHGVDCDLQGHLNTARYAAMFDAASWRLYGLLGYRWCPAARFGWADVKNSITYVQEVGVDAEIRVQSRITRLGGKSMTVVHEMFVDQLPVPAAVFELVVVQFDLLDRCAVEILPEYRRRASAYLSTSGDD